MAFSSDRSAEDTSFKKVVALPDETHLDGFKGIGHFSVKNPPGLPTGSYYLTCFSSKVDGASRIVQIVDNVLTAEQSYRAKNTLGWSAWTVRGSGGGGGSSNASGITYNDATQGYGIGTTPSVAAVLDDILLTLPKNPTREFNVLDYGAIPQGEASAATNRAAFEAAIVAAAAVGGGVIRAPKGEYYVSYGGSASLGGIRLRSNMTLKGDGIGVTIIKCADIGNNDLAGLVRTQSGIENSNVIVQDLTIDGNKAGQSGWANIICFFAGVTPGNRVLMDRNIWCLNVECRNGKNGTAGSANLSRGYGFDPHEVVQGFVAINCIAHDNERDGFVLDGVIDFALTGCRSYNNSRYGYNFITETFNGTVTNCHATSNVANNYMVQGDSHHIAITNCLSNNSGEQGIRIRRGAAVVDTFCTVSNCIIKGSSRNGINITGANYNLISNCIIQDSSSSANNTYMSVSLDEDDGDTLIFTGARNNVVQGCYAIETAIGANHAKHGIREDLTGAQPQNNEYKWNTLVGHVQGAYSTLNATSRRIAFSTDVYNAADYGVLSSLADCRVALQDLVDLVAANGGGLIRVPKGLYALSGTGTASQGGIRLTSGVHIQGAGIGLTTFRLIDMVNVGVTGVFRTLAGGSNSNISIEDLTLDGNAPAQTGTAIIPALYIGGATDAGIRIERCEFKGGNSATGHGARVSAATIGSATDITFRDCIFTSNEGDGLNIQGASGVFVENCTTKNNTLNGLKITDGSIDVQVSNHVSKSNAAVNYIVMDDASNVHFTGGISKSSGQEGFRIRRGATVSETHVTVDGMSIELSSRAGVNVAGASDNVFSNCVFLNNGQLTNSAYSDVLLNKDTTTTTTLAENNVFTGCKLNATGVNKTEYAFRETATEANLNRFYLNSARGQLTSKYLITGAGTLFRDDSNVGATLPGGSTTQVQYNNAGVFAGASGLLYDAVNNRGLVTTSLEILAASQTNAPDSSALLCSRALSSKIVSPAYADPIGVTRALQQRLSGKSFMSWSTLNHNGTTTSAVGVSLVVSTATNFVTTGFSARNVAGSTTKAGTVKRVGASGVSTAGSGLSVVTSSSQYITRGSAAGVGGFTFTTVFGVVTKSATARGFFGLSTTAGAATVPWIGAGAVNTGADIVGIGFDSGDTNLSIYTNDNVTTGTKTDLGATFPVVDGGLYELILSCGPNASDINYYVRNIGTDAVVSGTLTTDLPRNVTFLSPTYVMYNNTDAVGMVMDVSSVFIEQLN
jgi:hypothetical protein